MRPLCYLLCVPLLAPFAALAVTAFSSVDPSRLPTYAEASGSVVQTVVSALAAALIATAIGAALAFQVSFGSLPARRLLEKLLVLPLLFPTFVLGALYRELLAPSGLLARWTGVPVALTFELESTGGFVFVMVLGLYPYAYLLCRTAFASHGRAFVELGRSLGLSLSSSVRKVLVPLALPAILLGAALVAIETAGEWATASLLSARTSAVVVHQLWLTRDEPVVAAQLSMLLLLVALAALVPLVRWSRALGVRYLGVVPDAAPAGAPRSEDATSRWIRAGLCLIPVLLGFVVPAAVVLVFVAQTLGVIDLSKLLVNCLSTVVLIAMVCGACLVVALVLSATHRASGSWVTTWLVRWIGLSYVAPATVVAIGSLVLAEHAIAFVERYGDFTSLIILAATVSVRCLCFLLAPVLLGLSFLPRQLEETGASLGLDARSTFVRMLLPHMRGFVWLGLLLVAMQTLKETAISIVLHPFSFETLVLRTYAYIDINLLPESGTWILATALLGLYPLLTLESLLARWGAARS